MKLIGELKSKLYGMIKRATVICLSVVLLLNSIAFLPISAENEEILDNTDAERLASAEERLREGFLSFEREIDLSLFFLTLPELEKVFIDTIKNDPYLFYVNGNLSYTYRREGHIVSVLPEYDMSREEALERIDYCTRMVKSISELVVGYDTELEMILALHDLLCRSFSYDLTLQSDNMYSFLRERSGTCQGYAWTYMAVLRAIGFECEYAASDTLKHIWLLVNVDGEWYHSDPTWDDPPRNEGSGKTEYKHFLFSDKMAFEMGYRDWYSRDDIKCNSRKYDGMDFAAVMMQCGEEGDVFHNGFIDLYGLVTLERFLSSDGICGGEICLVCADMNRDFTVDECDIELFREKMLSGDKS